MSIKGNILLKLTTKFEEGLRPGEVIETSVGVYSHVSVVSDCRCVRGKPMLISATSRTGTVMEEPYDIVVAGRPTNYAPQQSTLPSHEILERARSQIGKWRYQMLHQNCEHFANWAAGLELGSRQVRGALLGAGVAATAVVVRSKKPNWQTCTFAALIGGVIGLASTQAVR